MPGPVWSEGINGEYTQLAAGQIKIESEQRQSPLSSEGGRRSVSVVAEDSCMPPRWELTVQCTLATFCLFSPWLCTIIKAHTWNSDIYFDIHVLFNVSCTCKRTSVKWFFPKYFILPNLHKADSDQRKVKFQKHVSFCLSKLVQILVLWDIHYLYDTMQVEFGTQETQNRLALN